LAGFVCLTNNYHGVGFLVRYHLFVLAAARSERSNRKRIQQKKGIRCCIDEMGIRRRHWNCYPYYYRSHGAFALRATMRKGYRMDYTEWNEIEQKEKKSMGVFTIG